MSRKKDPVIEAERFMEKYDVAELDETNLKNILFAQGYTVIDVDNDLSGENVQRMVTTLGLEELAKTAVCFTYSDRSYKLVFLKSELSPAEKTEALAREQWKIILGKFDNVDEENSTVAKRDSAKVFAHYILHPSKKYKLKRFLHHNSMKILAGIAFILLIVAIIILK